LGLVSIIRGDCLRIKLKLLVLPFLFSAIYSSNAHAFRYLGVDASGNDTIAGDDAGAIAVYTFDEAGGTVAYDRSAIGAPLDLTMSTAGNLPTSDGTPIRTNALLGGGYLIINPKPNGGPGQNADLGYQAAQVHRTFLVSSGAASKLNACTSGITIQAFIRSWFPFQGNSNYGNMIVGLSNTTETPRANGLRATTLAMPNFAIMQNGMSGSEVAQVNAGGAVQGSVPGAFASVREGENPGRLTEVIATLESNRILTVYVNRIPKSSTSAVNPNFLPGAKLVIGNELAPLPADRNIIDQANWSGEIHHVAIYCRGFSRDEIIGAIEQNKQRQDVVRPDSSVSSNPTKDEARRLMERLTGTLIPIDSPMLSRVEAKLAAGDRMGAVKIITGDPATGEVGHPDFLNTLVKQFALKMSTREETIRLPLNDFAASFIGITRDDRSAKELLTGDFYYMADPTKVRVRSDFFRDILMSNNHYEDLEAGQWNIGKVLMRVDQAASVPANIPRGQQIALSAAGAYTPNPDPAGVITSRAFMQAHAVAGTSRRLVEYAFREFMCVPMSQMADTAASPARIGRDVDRMPGGDSVKFETSCKGCHTVMDGFRGAFAHVDYANIKIGNQTYGVVRNTQINKTGDFAFSMSANEKVREVDNDITWKMNHNYTVFPAGYEITDDSFVNNAVGANNRNLFGWTGARARGGVGVNQFGQMIADSNRFSLCMAKRAIATVCGARLAPDDQVTPFMQSAAQKFKDGGYKLRALFQDVAATPACTAGLSK
jgi:hypothetical protein